MRGSSEAAQERDASERARSGPEEVLRAAVEKEGEEGVSEGPAVAQAAGGPGAQAGGPGQGGAQG
eukprot:2937329-Rhodomonas_salina.2